MEFACGSASVLNSVLFMLQQKMLVVTCVTCTFSTPEVEEDHVHRQEWF